jgi:DNA (cytosine-5)-methyltransferase 1
MALGMHAAGFEHEALVELDPRACGLLRANAERTPELWKADAVHAIDVRTWLKNLSKGSYDGIDLVAGGPPCQPFSTAGVHAGENDQRNMFPAAIESVRLIQPKLAVFENVPGLLRADFLPYYNYICSWLARPSITPREGEAWTEHHDRLTRSRAKAHYHVYREVVHAADYGVAQARTRVFLIAIRQDVLGATTWPGLVPTHSRTSLLWDQWITGSYWAEHGIDRPPGVPARFVAHVRDLRWMESRPTDDRWRTVRDLVRTLPRPVDGQEANDVLNHVGIPGARSYKGHTGSPIDSPAKTIKAGVHGVCGGEAMIRYPDDTLRYLTVREAARVQSFPDDYAFDLARTRAMRYIGNAVAVDIAAMIGRRLLAHTGLSQLRDIDPV